MLWKEIILELKATGVGVEGPERRISNSWLAIAQQQARTNAEDTEKEPPQIHRFPHKLHPDDLPVLDVPADVQSVAGRLLGEADYGLPRYLVVPPTNQKSGSAKYYEGTLLGIGPPVCSGRAEDFNSLNSCSSLVYWAVMGGRPLANPSTLEKTALGLGVSGWPDFEESSPHLHVAGVKRWLAQKAGPVLETFRACPRSLKFNAGWHRFLPLGREAAERVVSQCLVNLTCNYAAFTAPPAAQADVRHLVSLNFIAAEFALASDPGMLPVPAFFENACIRSLVTLFHSKAPLIELLLAHQAYICIPESAGPLLTTPPTWEDAIACRQLDGGHLMSGDLLFQVLHPSLGDSSYGVVSAACQVATYLNDVHGLGGDAACQESVNLLISARVLGQHLCASGLVSGCLGDLSYLLGALGQLDPALRNHVLAIWAYGYALNICCVRYGTVELALRVPEAPRLEPVRLNARLGPTDGFVLSRSALLGRIGELAGDAPLPEVADLVNGAQAQMVLTDALARAYRGDYTSLWAIVFCTLEGGVFDRIALAIDSACPSNVDPICPCCQVACADMSPEQV
ncbi:uncharacterized protein LDX57_003124 [Aspergillus melleus]|uniref:uncharacterized protein n=1 Tax=Aspergillus melleus TaxID=138277 RepID=UPI001E8EC45A|nr:uncharacterized protein LDX57_003124 [Aspergillus melleus]KAH8425371.1 hypothetical protein LDX57_003124 [Aspergillus melleus]